MRFRKKPVEIQAIQFTSEESFLEMAKAWGDEFAQRAWGDTDTGGLVISTLEGKMTAQPGDYIIRGIAGEFYPCRQSIFEATYEKV